MEKIETKQDHIDFLTEYVISGKMKMFNEVSKEFIKVTESNVNDIAEMLYDMSIGHGISHLSYIVT
tara:strand:+ start:2667 stop:2864 length:198 start_codon:yes stop_codon:yes gene_type:complete